MRLHREVLPVGPGLEPGRGREAQRRRTRKAIVDAAIRLSANESTPSIDEIAAAADVSRRTIYMHFATLDQISALTIVVGWEAQIALRDVRGLDDPQAEQETITWAARVLVEAMVKESETGRRADTDGDL